MAPEVHKKILGSAVFVGTSAYAVPVLETLLDLIEVTAVITKTDEDVLSEVAKRQHLKLFLPEHIEEVESTLRELEPTVMVVAHYGQIIPERILKIPSRGTINLHPSLLPRHRGPAPVPATILAGDHMTGTTIIQMDSKMDHGPILGQSSLQLQGNEFADDLLTTLWKLSAELLREVLPDYLQGQRQPVEQDHAAATTHHFMKRDDGRITSQMTVNDIWKRYRAYRPWPGVWIEIPLHHKITRVKILVAQLSSEQFVNHAEHMLVWRAGHLYLLAIDGVLEIVSLQRAGAPQQSAEAFYRGYHDSIPTL